MDRLTEQQRRRIYEEEKKKEAARRSRASNRRSLGCLAAIGIVLLSMVVIVTLARAGALDRHRGPADRRGGSEPPMTRLPRVPLRPRRGRADVVRGRRVAQSGRR